MSNPTYEYSLEGLNEYILIILKNVQLHHPIFTILHHLQLELQYFGHVILRVDSLEKTLMLEKIEGRRGRR